MCANSIHSALLTFYSFRASSSHLQKRQPHALNCRRNFSQSSPFLKKKSAADREEKAKEAQNLGPPEDPNDFSTLDSAISSALETLEGELLKLRTGGRFNPEILEDIRVRLVAGKPTEKLRDLAQVLPKGGRTLMILVGEKDVSYLVAAHKDRN
jgi:ribosome recycling factor